ncbi:hypothetical protein [Algibacter lectus]|uniref:Lipoprotein n=1 Tax=Algibacter lectus TaxID=221126 RepID=A0A090VM72_9FLAO|nr:hypothetical protein [Algibacter lectus]GAL65118.1 hypothetical protein JCM19300_401 [Algibacter lectus]
MRNLRITLIFSIIILTISCKNKEVKSENKNSNIGQFRFIISDTLAYGKNLARISEYNRKLKENESSVIAVIIENELEDGSTKIDTFSDGLKTPFFGISKYQTGKHKIEIKVEEKMMRTKKLPNDSLSLEIKDIYYTYKFHVFIKDKVYISELNEILSKQMDIEYNENPI